MKSEAASHFWSDSYEEERINPEPNQRWYLILSDLKRALDAFATNEALKILDFGCGGSPYRSLFPNSDYKRADVKQYPGVDFLIDDNGRIDVPDNRFDLVWSTQVAEHVHHPEAYFAEMYRLLKPGGRLVVSTHGSYEDHGCPHDYQRWTPWGLRRDLEKAGFHSIDIKRSTTDMRALLCLADNIICWAVPVPNRLAWIFLRILRWFFGTFRSWINRCADACLAHQRVVDGDVPFHDFYIVLVASAVK